MNAAEKFNVSPHPAAEIFPLMQGADFDALVADIKEHGQREPIILHSGQILDGRNRHRACVELGIDPTFLEWHGDGTPEAFVISMNLHRRHLDASQRGLVAARIANLRYGHNQHSKEGTGIPVPKAAVMLNVNKETVSDARTVLLGGTEEEIVAVEQGQAAVSTLAKAIRTRVKATGSPLPTPPAVPNTWVKVKLKDGLTMETVCRQGLTLEATGASPENAADRIGVGRLTYSKMRDVVFLADRPGLRPKDAEIAQRALAEMNAAQQVVRATEMIEPLKARVWGTQRGSRTNAEANRLEAFERSFGALIQACSMTGDIELPYLSTERAALAIEELTKAEKAMRELKNRIKEQCQ